MTNKLFVFIISCQNYKDNWENLMNTMAQLNIKAYYIICGNPNLETDYLLDDNILYIKCNDYYEGLTEKVTKLYNYAVTSDYLKEYTHFLKVDDTNKFDPKIVFETLEESIVNDYEGYEINKSNRLNRKYHFGRCHSPLLNVTYYKYKFVPWCYGSFYILSRKALLCFENICNDEIKEEYYEDLYVARRLLKSGIHPHINMYLKYDKKASFIYCD